MKRLILFCALLLVVALQAGASLFTNVFDSGFANSGYVPDANFSGWSDTRNLSAPEYTGFAVLDVQVTLNVSGGWNGDLYGYLVHDSGFVVLLDRVGSSTYSPYGYGEAGFTNVRLIDGNPSYTTSIENYGGSSSAAAALSGGNYNSQGGTLNTSFDGLNVSGNWTLFLADLSSGDISQVTGWTLTIEAVPEPTTYALMLVGAAFGGWRLSQRRTKSC